MQNYLLINKNRIFYWVLFFCIFVIGSYFRIRLFINNFDLYCDEGALVMNLINMDYWELFTPLKYGQVAPPMFLVLSKFAYKLLDFNYSAYFSDLLLRSIPTISGIISIPAFGYMLNKLFKNKFINLVGMLIISLNPAAISHCGYFKQYETELLITIIIISLAALVDYKKSKNQNTVIFCALAITPLFSMTAVFILFGAMLYLLIKAINEKHFKLFLKLSIPFFIIFLTYLGLILYPVYSTYYGRMQGFWHNTTFTAIPKSLKSGIYMHSAILTVFRTYYNTFLTGTLTAVFFCGTVMLFKNINKFILLTTPLILLHIFWFLGIYPTVERFLVFAIPLIITIMLAPITLIEYISNKYMKFFIYTITILTSLNFINSVDAPEQMQLKQETTRKAFEYLASQNPSERIFFGPSNNNAKYYLRFYGQNLNSGVKYSAKTVKKILPECEKNKIYYTIITKEYEPTKKNLSKIIDIIDEKKMNKHTIQYNKERISAQTGIIKFKLKNKI